MFEPGYYKLSKVVEGFSPPELWATHSSRTADSRSKHQRVSAAVRANQEIEQPSPPPLSKGVGGDHAAFCSQGSDQMRRTYGLLSGCSSSQADLVVQTSCPQERHLRKGTLTFDILTNCQISTVKQRFQKSMSPLQTVQWHKIFGDFCVNTIEILAFLVSSSKF